MAGADRALTMDLHSAQIQGFFDIPFDHLYAAPVLIEYFAQKNIPDLVVVAPDIGGVEDGARLRQAPGRRPGARRQAPAAARRGRDHEHHRRRRGQERRCCSTTSSRPAGTLCQAAEAIRAAGRARTSTRGVTHGVFVPGLVRAHRRLADQGAGDHRHAQPRRTCRCRRTSRELSVAGSAGRGGAAHPRGALAQLAVRLTHRAPSARPDDRPRDPKSRRNAMAVIPLKRQAPRAARQGRRPQGARAGEIPGVLYGHGEDAGRRWRSGAREFEVALRAAQGRQRDRQPGASARRRVHRADPRRAVRPAHRASILHLDFQHISLTETIEVEGRRAPDRRCRSASRTAAASSSTSLRELEVRCLPTAIPPSIDVDVSAPQHRRLDPRARPRRCPT